MAIEGSAVPHSRRDEDPLDPSLPYDESRNTEQPQEVDTILLELMRMRRRLSRRLEEIGELPEQLVRVGLYAEASAALDRREQVQTALAEIDRRIGSVADGTVDTEPRFDRPHISHERSPVPPRSLNHSVEPAYPADGEVNDSEPLSDVASRPPESSPGHGIQPDDQVTDGRANAEGMLTVATASVDAAPASPINQDEPTRNDIEQRSASTSSEDQSWAPVVDHSPPVTAQVTDDRPPRWIRGATLLVSSVVVLLVVSLLVGRALRDSSVSGASDEARETTSASEPTRRATELIGNAAVSTIVPTPDSAPAAIPTPSQIATEATRLSTSGSIAVPSPYDNRLVAVSSATSTPTPTPTITATAVSISTTDAIADRAMKAVATLVRGRMDVVMTYPEQGRSTSIVLFDIDTGVQPMRLHLTTAYDSNGAAQTIERIIIGSQAWERQGDAPWTTVGQLEGVWGQVQAFLPRIPQGVEYGTTPGSSTATITWYDSARNADVLLTVDPVTGVPRELQQISRDSGSQIVVTYTSWNQPVEIQAPQ